MKEVIVQAYTFDELYKSTQTNIKEKFTVAQGLMVDYFFNDNPEYTLKTKIKDNLHLNGIPEIFLNIFSEFEIFNHSNGISFISISMNKESFFLNSDLITYLMEISLKNDLISSTTYYQMMELISNKHLIEIKKEIKSLEQNSPDLFLDFYTEIFFDNKELLILAKETPTFVKYSFKLKNIIEVCLNNLIIKSNKLLNKDSDILEEYKDFQFQNYANSSLFLESGQKILQYKDIKQNTLEPQNKTGLLLSSYGQTIGNPVIGVIGNGSKT